MTRTRIVVAGDRRGLAIEIVGQGIELCHRGVMADELVSEAAQRTADAGSGLGLVGWEW